jgi:desulfoferrodoxin (superoxide reductase-like protein)
MKSGKTIVFFISLLMILSLSAGMVWAGKTSVTLNAPAEVPQGSEITIMITVTHSANSYFHYTEWVRVIINNQEMARWNYSASKRPEAAIFTKEIKYTVNTPVEIKAEGSCNIHGSQGPAFLKVSLKD